MPKDLDHGAEFLSGAKGVQVATTVVLQSVAIR